MQSIRNAVLGRIPVKHLLVCAATLVLALGGPAACGGDGDGGGGGSDEDQVRSLLNKELKAFQDQDPEALYGLASPAFRSACSYDSLEADIEGYFDGIAQDYGVSDPKELEYTNVVVNVDGDRATPNYYVEYEGEDVGTDSTEYFKIDGRWYNSSDTSNCDSW